MDKTDKIPLIYIHIDFRFPKADLKMREVMEILNKNFILEVCFEKEYITKYNFSLK